jgi:hypothetical protein
MLRLERGIAKRLPHVHHRKPDSLAFLWPQPLIKFIHALVPNGPGREAKYAENIRRYRQKSNHSRPQRQKGKTSFQESYFDIFQVADSSVSVYFTLESETTLWI